MTKIILKMNELLEYWLGDEDVYTLSSHQIGVIIKKLQVKIHNAAAEMYKDYEMDNQLSDIENNTAMDSWFREYMYEYISDASIDKLVIEFSLQIQ